MKRLIYRLSLCLLVAMVTQACKQSAIAPIENDGVAPGPVTGVTVTNLSGAAKITYKVPPDLDLLYVRAVYTTKQGETRETKVSSYNNNLTVVGFGDTDSYEVKLYAVDKGGNVSQPTSVTVKPLTAPFKLIRNSLQVTANFGGIDVAYQNSTEADIAIVILMNNSVGDFVPVNTGYTNLKQGVLLTRGLQAAEAKFGVYVRDRWGNLSDTLTINLTPLYEVRLDRTLMKEVKLPTDATLGFSGTVSALFDGVSITGAAPYYHSNSGNVMPQWFTYDMGVTAKISRMVWWMRSGFYFDLHAPRKVEIWGSNNPAADGSFNGWTLLTTYEQIKPSGLPNGQLSTADNEAALAGETITIPLDAPKVRYIRWKTLRNWSDGPYVNFTEIAMYGDPRP